MQVPNSINLIKPDEEASNRYLESCWKDGVSSQKCSHIKLMRGELRWQMAKLDGAKYMQKNVISNSDDLAKHFYFKLGIS